MRTPFPWLPIVAIMICIVTVVYTLSNLFPYSGYMVQQLGVTDDKDEAGFYAGYLSSAFMLGRFSSSYFWGRVADRYGRVPVIHMGLCSIAFLSVAFGLSTTFFWAIACRFLTGALTGIVATAKTVVSEVCGSEHEVVGMSFITGSWSIGLVLGSGVGGLLSEPAKHYPTFSESGLFGRFPYLLPNIVGASLALISLLVVFLFLEETLDANKSGDRRSFESISTPMAELPSQEAAAEEGGNSSTTCLTNDYDPQLAGGGNTGGSNGSSVEARADERLPLVRQGLRPPSGERELKGGELCNVHDGAGGNARSGGGGAIEGERAIACGVENGGGGSRMTFLTECFAPMRLFQEKRVRTYLFVYALNSFLFIGLDEAYPLWTISSVSSGGLDWTTQEIGQTLSACGGSIFIFQLLIFPRIVARIGPIRPQRWACCVAIPGFLAFPFLHQLRDSEGVLMVASVVLLFFTSAAGNTVFTNISVAINNAVDPSKRGSINGLSMMLGSVATTIGPTVCATVFAWSINCRRYFPLDRHLIFCLFALVMVVVTVTTWNIVIFSSKQNSKGSVALRAVVADEVAGGAETMSLSSVA